MKIETHDNDGEMMGELRLAYGFLVVVIGMIDGSVYDCDGGLVDGIGIRFWEGINSTVDLVRYHQFMIMIISM